MAQFRVRWEVDIEAGTAFEAATQARKIQQDPFSIATVFEVAELKEFRSIIWEKVDLLDEVGKVSP